MPIVVTDSVSKLKGPHVCLWAGPVRRPQTSNNQSDLHVELVFAKLNDSARGGAFLSEDQLSSRIIVSISVIELARYRVGSIWSSGYHVGSFGEEVVFDKLNFSEASDKLLTFRDLALPGGWLISERGFRVHPKVFQSHLVRTEFHGVNRSSISIIFSCWELACYFYGGSQNFFRAVMMNGLVGGNDFYDPDPKQSRFDAESKTVHVELRTEMKNSDRFLIGRLIADDRYRNVAKVIAKSLSLGVKDVGVFPQCYFPVIGDFYIKCKGMRLRSENGREYFLVFKILDSEIDESYENMIWDRKNDNRQGGNYNEESLKEYSRKVSARKNRVPDGKRIRTVAEGSGLDKKAHFIEHVQAYTSPFSRRRIARDQQRPKTKQTHRRFRNPETPDAITDEVTTNPDTSVDGSNDRIQFENAVTPPLLDRTLMFIAIKERLNELGEVECDWLELNTERSHEDGHFSDFAWHLDEEANPNIQKWLFTSRKSARGKRRRRFMVFHALHVKTQKHYYVLDIEPLYKSCAFRMNVVYAQPAITEIDYGELVEIASYAVYDRGAWNEETLSAGISSQRFNHQMTKTHRNHKGVPLEQRKQSKPLSFEEAVELNAQKINDFLCALSQSKDME